jgi:hypothetical protein
MIAGSGSSIAGGEFHHSLIESFIGFRHQLLLIANYGHMTEGILLMERRR